MQLTEVKMPSLQKNPGRLVRQIRQQPNIDLWKKWAYEIKKALADHEEQYGVLPGKGSRLPIIDKHRRMFDSHGSSLEEAIRAAVDDDAYWQGLAAHPGAAYASDRYLVQSASDAYDEVRRHPGFNPKTLELRRKRIAKDLR